MCVYQSIWLPLKVVELYCDFKGCMPYEDKCTKLCVSHNKICTFLKSFVPSQGYFVI